MSEIQYKDPDGNNISLYKLVRDEPDWAVSIIKMGEGLRQEIEALKAEVKRFREALVDMSHEENSNLRTNIMTAALHPREYAIIQPEALNHKEG